MYSWNDLKINVEGSNKEFLDGVRKYINAVYIHDYEGDCDVNVTVYNSNNEGFPEVPAGSKKIKSLVYNMNTEIRLDVFSSGKQSWYIYRNTAGIWFNPENNEMQLWIEGMPLDFEYYNVLIFFLHPLGTLLESLGYFRLSGSCGALDNQAVIFAGPHGSGKSTSSFTIPTHGGHIISDDLTFVWKDDSCYHASSLTRLVGLGLDTANKFFPELNRVHSAAFFNENIYYFLEDINSSRPEEVKLSVIAFLNKSGKKATACSEAKPAEIMPLLFPDGIHTNIEENTGARFLFIAELLEQVKTCKLTFGTDMNDFIDHIKKIL